MSKGIVVVGSINADLTTTVERHPNPGETLLGEGGHFSAGGKGANQAVAAGLLGAEVAFVGAVGDDVQAQAATVHFERAGINTEGISTRPGTPTGLAVITVANSGENSIIVVPGANSTVNASYVKAHRSLIEEAKLLLLQGEIPAEGIEEAITLTQGRVVINLAPVIELNPEALLKADPLLANEHEAGLILQQLGRSIDSDDPHALAAALLEAGFASVVLTLGSAGALVATPGELTDIPTPKIEAVDTTGCGDAFAGAFCFRLADGDDLITAARFAAQVGAAAATRRGAQDSYPSAGDELPAVS